MKREIKFRVYTSDEGMIYSDVDCFISINSDGSINDSGIPKHNVMQFTGLKDKFKKDIFEGDIVTNNKYKWSVEWHDQMAMWWLNPIISTKIKGDEYLVEMLNHEQLGNGYYSRDDLEIIGNIYQNKDLLK